MSSNSFTFAFNGLMTDCPRFASISFLVFLSIFPLFLQSDLWHYLMLVAFCYRRLRYLLIFGLTPFLCRLRFSFGFFIASLFKRFGFLCSFIKRKQSEAIISLYQNVRQISHNGADKSRNEKYVPKRSQNRVERQKTGRKTEKEICMMHDFGTNISSQSKL